MDQRAVQSKSSKSVSRAAKNKATAVEQGDCRITAVLMSRFAVIFDGTLQVHRDDAVEDNADTMW